MDICHTALAMSCRPHFRWLSPGDLPEVLDLRGCGWGLADEEAREGDCPGLIDAHGLNGFEMMQLLAKIERPARGAIIVARVHDSQRRALLLRFGFADTVGPEVKLDEICCRMARVMQRSDSLPRFRQFGPLKLDLLGREAYVESRALNLNPREFALLWRLADIPNVTVSKQALMRDVWRMGFLPETNSIAVHMSRLRRKLSFADLARIVETCPSGGYRLRVPMELQTIGESPDELALLLLSFGSTESCALPIGPVAH